MGRIAGWTRPPPGRPRREESSRRSARAHAAIETELRVLWSILETLIQTVNKAKVDGTIGGEGRRTGGEVTRPHCPRSPETAQSRDGGARNLAANTRPLGGGGEGCVFHVKRNEAKVTDRDIRTAKRRGSRRWIREPRLGDASVDQSLMTTTRREGSAPSLSLDTPSTFATAS